MNNPRSYIVAILLTLACVISVATPAILATKYVPLGEGLDEFSHLDYMSYRFLYPAKEIRVEEGLYRPGFAPLGQGHQAPLYYALGYLLGIPLDRNEIGAFIDYQSGVQYSSKGVTLGGLDHCPIREDPFRTDAETAHFRNSLKSIRMLSALMAGAVLLIAFVAGRNLFPGQEKLALALAFLVGANPTGIWRGVYVNNDNVVALFGAATFAYGLRFLRPRESHPLREVAILSLLAAATFLSKYNGIVAFSLVGGAFLLTPNNLGSVRKHFSRIVKFSVVAALVVAAALLPNFLRNLAVDGDILSQRAAIVSTPFLYRPSSFWTILTDPRFLRTALSRFWVEYHSIAILDPTFPPIVYLSWHWSLYVAAAGTLLFLVKIAFRRERGYLRGFLYTLIGATAAIVILVQLGASFPTPGGRYLHTVLVPISALVLFGIYQLFRSIPGVAAIAEQVVLGISLTAFLSFHTFTFIYLSERYGPCRNSPAYNVDGGAEVVPLNLDGLPGDELAIFHRSRNRTFFAGSSGTEFSIKPEWTRSVGLMGDKLLKSDTDGDSKDELIFWRPAYGIWSFVYPDPILKHDETLSPSRDLSLFVDTFFWRSKRGDVPLVGNLVGDAADEVIIYRPNEAQFYIFQRRPEDQKLWYRAALVKGGRKKQHPLILTLNGKKILGTFSPASGNLTLYKMDDTIELEQKLDPAKEILTVDTDNDGTDELLLWNQGSQCARSHSLREFTSVREICFERNGKPFRLDRHRKVDPLRMSDGAGGISVFDKIDGSVTAFRLSSDRPEANVFDPGWTRGMNFRE